ncbi:MAG: DUF3037 domain-containing protein [Ignavibacteriae bacterium]|nr:DUF3037 domain-containing protein [Ignavibacteriota bacterium]
MKTYEFSILRYLHDQVTGEFINVGVILYSKEEKSLQAKFIENAKRLSDFFHGIDGRRIKNLIQGLNTTIIKIDKKLKSELNLDGLDSLEKICNYILPKDDSALYFSETKFGRSIELQNALENLSNKIIRKYEFNNDKKSFSDEEVWQQVYKKYFDENLITEKLNEEFISTENDSFHFNLCWTNGKLNIYKPISFDYVEQDRLKNKIYRWDGILRELITSEKIISLNFLTKYPSNKLEYNISKLIKEKLLIDADKIQTKIIYESDIKNFISDLKEEIISHK